MEIKWYKKKLNVIWIHVVKNILYILVWIYLCVRISIKTCVKIVKITYKLYINQLEVYTTNIKYDIA